MKHKSKPFTLILIPDTEASTTRRVRVNSNFKKLCRDSHGIIKCKLIKNKNKNYYATKIIYASCYWRCN